ncbi:hypothetical protein ACFDTO_34915 [Microbacteriaceae bacterium 4G12]
MRKKIMQIIAAFTLVFATLSFVSVDQAMAKGYKSGKKSYTPSQNQPAPSKQDTNINAKKTTPDTKTTNSKTTKSNKGSFVKGLLLGGLGGLLMGSLFSGLGSFGSVLAFLVNMLMFVGIIMIIRRAFIYFKQQRERKVEESWRR